MIVHVIAVEKPMGKKGCRRAAQAGRERGTDHTRAWFSQQHYLHLRRDQLFVLWCHTQSPLEDVWKESSSEALLLFLGGGGGIVYMIMKHLSVSCSLPEPFCNLE